MSISDYKILFDHREFLSGEPVKGFVCVTIIGIQELSSIEVRIVGLAKVGLTTNDFLSEFLHELDIDDLDSDEDLLGTGRQSLLSKRLIIYETKGIDYRIQPGEYSYPFQFLLPPNMPTSYEGKRGYVRYTIIAALTRPWKEDLVIEETFNVITPIDLNSIEIAQLPIVKELKKTYGFKPIWTRDIDIFLKIPYGGFIPQQVFSVMIDVKNFCWFNIHNIKIEFFNEVIWTINTPMEKHLKELVKITEWSLGPVNKFSDTVCTYDCRMPAVTPLFFDSCKIIKCNYFFNVKVILPRFHKDIQSRIPIAYGTLPLNTSLTSLSLETNSVNNS